MSTIPKLVEAARAQGLKVSQGFTETEDTVFPDGLYDVISLLQFPGAPAGPQYHAPGDLPEPGGRRHGAYHGAQLRVHHGSRQLL